MQELIKKIHQSPFKVTIVSSGGGTEAISSLLQVPGASNTILESYIPYAKESMDAYLNKKPDHYCSMQTCLSMAANAYKSCSKIASKTKSKYLIGISITASLATTYTKIGDHKFYIVLQTSSYTKSVACILDKNTRSRKEEEELIANYVMHLLGEACGIKVNKPSHSEDVDISKTNAEK